MEKISHEVMIDLPHEACWARLRDLSRAHHYVPDVVRTEITTPEAEGVGASRKVYLKDDVEGMDETVIDWRDGDGFTIRLHKGAARAIPIFNVFHFHYAIEARGEKTAFRPAISYETRFGPVGKLLSAIALKKRFQQTLAVIGQSMKEYYESGEPTSPARIAALRAEVSGQAA